MCSTTYLQLSLMQVEDCIHEADRVKVLNYSKTIYTFVFKGHTYDKSLLLYITSK